MSDPRERRARARTLFLEAIERDVEERERFVRDRCGDDADLERDVRELLAADDPAFLEAPAFERAGVTKPDLARVPPPSRVGPYRVLEEIGEGGMGVVYLAQQDEPVRRRVALKLIKPGMDSRAIIRRFEAERQALALMDHPGIARVIDAGTTDDGHPYFVMEHVAGLSVAEYCDRHRLSIRARVELMTEICRAVQHAHQKGIIHRDLKASNVLVTVAEDGARAKVIDFGLAKAIGATPLARQEFTWAGGFVGTLETMSPEQAGVTGLDVDTRTDVYSLGVLLYQLLAGALPFERARVDEALLSGQPGRLFEVDSPPPSVRARALPDLEEVARRRRTTPAGLVRRLSGDLDRICGMAMEHDRTLRYATPTELARDLERHVADEPVLAGPPRVTYRLAKFLKRRKDVVTSTALVLGALVAAVVFTTDARIEAEREADHARQMTDFLTWAFTSVDPNLQLAHPDLTVVDLLKRAAVELDGGFLMESPPDVQARIRAVIGETMYNLGRLEEAEPQLLRSWEALRDRDPDALETLETGNRYALLLIDQNRVDEAEPILRDTLARFERVAERDHAGAVTARNGLASILYLTGALEEAEEMQRGTLEIVRRSARSDDETMLQSLFGLGRLLGRQRRYAEARDLFRELLDVQRRSRGEEHPTTLRTMNALAEALVWTGDRDEAEALWLETHALMTTILGADHPLSLRVALNIGEFATRQRGDPERAEPYFRDALASARATLDRDHPLVASARYDLGECLYRRQRWDEAEGHLLETAEWIRRHRGPDDAGRLGVLMMLRRIWLCQGRLGKVERSCREQLDSLAEGESSAGARGNLLLELGACLRHRGEFDEAIRALREALECWRGAADARVTTSAQEVLAQCLIDAGRLDEAAEVLDELEAACVENFGEESDGAARAMTVRARLLGARGDTTGAERRLRDALALAERQEESITVHWVTGALGRFLVDRGASAEARGPLETAFEQMRVQLGPKHPTVRAIGDALVLCLEQQDDPERAAEVRAALR